MTAKNKKTFMEIFVSELVNSMKKAYEIVKLNKKVTEEVINSEESTKFAWIYLTAPALVYILYECLYYKTISMVSVFLLPALSIILSIYTIHYISIKFFRGKGDLCKYTRLIGYINSIQVLVFLNILLESIGLANIFNLVYLVISVLMLIVTYNYLGDAYKINQQNRIAVMVMGYALVGVLMAILQNIMV